MRTLVVPLVAVPLLLLAGCVPQPVEPGPVPTTTPAPSGTATATATPEPTATAPATPIGFGCADFVTAQEMYDYNPIFSEVGYTATSGSVATEAVEIGGIACRWVNTSSGSTIDFSVAMPGASGLDSLEAGLAGTAASAFEGYFDNGTAQAFTGAYWLTVSSTEFVSDADVTPLIEIAIAGLP